MSRPFWSLALLALALLSAGLARAETETGRRVYQESCAICHGANGDGRGEAAAQLATAPRDFTKGVYKFRSTGSGALPTDADLLRSVVCGIPGTGMVPQNHLSDADVAAVIDELKRFSPRFAKASAPKPLRIPPPVPRAPELIERGKAVYGQMECKQCHGEQGRGDGPSAKSLSVRPTDFTQRPLKSGSEPGDLVRTMLTGLDGTPMPSYDLLISDVDVWALAYYLQSLGGAPAKSKDEHLGWVIEKREPGGEAIATSACPPTKPANDAAPKAETAAKPR